MKMMENRNQRMEKEGRSKPVDNLSLVSTEHLYLVNPREPLWSGFEQEEFVSDVEDKGSALLLCQIELPVVNVEESNLVVKDR